VPLKGIAARPIPPVWVPGSGLSRCRVRSWPTCCPGGAWPAAGTAQREPVLRPSPRVAARDSCVVRPLALFATGVCSACGGRDPGGRIARPRAVARWRARL